MTNDSAPHARQLLVSIQNVHEARLALAAGIPWIDLKNPSFGSLGRPALPTAVAVAQELTSNATKRCQISVAIGELQAVDMLAARDLMRLFPIAKVGLAGLGSSDSSDRSALERLAELQGHAVSPGQVVLAIYADHQRAVAPSPARTLKLAERIGSRYVLIDTYLKDGRGVFHWSTPCEIIKLRERAAAFGAELVVAGSLKTDDWPRLAQLGSVIIGVRGAACEQSGDRSSRLCPERLNQWLTWTKG